MYLGIDADTRDLLDTLMQHNNSKITIIKFLRNKLKIGLALSKRLYEERQRFLIGKVNPFGW